MPKRDYATPADLRFAIERRRVIRFYRKGTLLEAEPHLFGSAQKTFAMILVIWVRGEDGGWQVIRFNEVRGLEVADEVFSGCRPGFAKYKSSFWGVDTCIHSLPEQLVS